MSITDDIHAVWLFLKNMGIIFGHLYWLVIIVVAMVFMGGMLLARADNKPIWKSIYLAFITALTIGYGDITPHTHRAKVISIFIGLLGLVITGVVVAAAIKAAETTIEEIEMLPVEDIEKHPLADGSPEFLQHHRLPESP
ncbi:potassium channel family protein [Poriferisphaera sp. WC338]|uniref:potassium channel family protein n=1 Tax=Poriferisphaera sp. WC338 TaxID=3425129 RepID=UPI003D81B579